MVERGTKMLTQEQFMDYVNNHLKFHLLGYQKTALWEFYKILMLNKDEFPYRLFGDILEAEHSLREP